MKHLKQEFDKLTFKEVIIYIFGNRGNDCRPLPSVYRFIHTAGG